MVIVDVVTGLLLTAAILLLLLLVLLALFVATTDVAGGVVVGVADCIDSCWLASKVFDVWTVF